MAFQASFAILHSMGQGEGRVDLTVTGLAGVGSERGDVTVMTVVTRERLTRRRALMAIQGESHHLMRKLRTLHHCEWRVGAAMFGMAMTAAQICIVVQHFAVHRGNVLHLRRDLAMTGRAPICHLRIFPRRDMARLTVPARLRMRGDAAQPFPGLGVQGAGVVHQASLCIGIAGNDECRDDGSQNSYPR